MVIEVGANINRCILKEVVEINFESCAASAAAAVPAAAAVLYRAVRRLGKWSAPAPKVDKNSRAFPSSCTPTSIDLSVLAALLAGPLGAGHGFRFGKKERLE